MKDRTCPYCGKKFCKYGIKGHIWRVHTKTGQSHEPWKNITPWNAGLTKNTDNNVKKNGSAIKHAFDNGANKGWSKGHKHSIETRDKLREQALKRYASGWEVRCGRAKKYTYKSPVAGEIKVDGLWELSVAYYLDKIGVTWNRNKKRFPYINLNGKQSTYCPDFWVDNWCSYLEVKGYKTDLDECKWSQFEDKLLIWDYNVLVSKGIVDKQGGVAESVKALVC